MRSSVRRAAGARLSPTCTSYGAGLRRHAASFGSVTRSMFSQRGVVAGKWKRLPVPWVRSSSSRMMPTTVHTMNSCASDAAACSIMPFVDPM